MGAALEGVEGGELDSRGGWGGGGVARAKRLREGRVGVGEH